MQTPDRPPPYFPNLHEERLNYPTVSIAEDWQNSWRRRKVTGRRPDESRDQYRGTTGALFQRKVILVVQSWCVPAGSFG